MHGAVPGFGSDRGHSERTFNIECAVIDEEDVGRVGRAAGEERVPEIFYRPIHTPRPNHGQHPDLNPPLPGLTRDHAGAEDRLTWFGLARELSCAVVARNDPLERVGQAGQAEDPHGVLPVATPNQTVSTATRLPDLAGRVWVSKAVTHVHIGVRKCPDPVL